MDNMESTPPNRVVIAMHPKLDKAPQIAEDIAAFIRQQDVETEILSLNDASLRENIEAGNYELLIALGGDGTMLRAGHLCAPSKIPVLGINLGGLGFLIDVGPEDWQPAMAQVMSGDYWLEDRMMLRTDHYQDGKVVGSWEVINECVIGRGKMVRPVQLTTEIDNLFLTTYVADALIVSTPTGSTAYAFAAGGPILPPELRNILIVPVAPHLSVDRGIVLHEGSQVWITIRTDHDASISIDGQDPVQIRDKDRVHIRASEHVVTFMRVQDPDYFYRNLTSRMNRNPSIGDPA